MQNRQRQMELQNDAAGAASFGAAPSREREEEAQPAESSRRCTAFTSAVAGTNAPKVESHLKVTGVVGGAPR